MSALKKLTLSTVMVASMALFAIPSSTAEAAYPFGGSGYGGYGGGISSAGFYKAPYGGSRYSRYGSYGGYRGYSGRGRSSYSANKYYAKQLYAKKYYANKYYGKKSYGKSYRGY